MARLTKIDWITAGFRALTSGGPQAINIEKIAIDLKVSKGSFYWHFKNLAAYKHAMLVYWQHQGTQDIISRVAANQSSPVEQLKDLITQTGELSLEHVGGRRAESAVRDWARYDPEVAKLMASIDQTRLEFVTELFKQSGQNNADAEFSGRILYACLIGLGNMSIAQSPTPQHDLTELLNQLLSR